MGGIITVSSSSEINGRKVTKLILKLTDIGPRVFKYKLMSGTQIVQNAENQCIGIG